MIEINVEDLKIGAIIANPVFSGKNVLVKAGCVVTDKLIERFHKFDIPTVYIEGKKAVVAPDEPVKNQVDMYNSGEFVCKQGDKSNSIYILNNGELDVIVCGEDPVTDEEVFEKGNVVATLKGENINFGEIGAILGVNRSASIVAKITSRVTRIPVKDNSLFSTINSNPVLGMQIAKTLAGRIDQTSEKILNFDVLFKKIKEKSDYLASAFFKIAEIIGKKSKDFKDKNYLTIHNKIKNTSFYSYSMKVARRKDEEISDAQGEYKEILCDINNIKEYEMNDTVVKQDDVLSEMYILVSGRLGVYVGDKRISTVCQRGAVIGATDLILADFGEKTFRKSLKTIKAVAYTQLMVVNGKGFKERIKQDPSLISHIIKELAEILPHANKVFIEEHDDINNMMALIKEAGKEFEEIYKMFERFKNSFMAPVENDMKVSKVLFDKAVSDYKELSTEIDKLEVK